MSKKIVIIALALVVIMGLFIYKPGLRFWSQSGQVPKLKVVGVVYIRQHIDAYNGFKDGMKKIGYEVNKNVAYDEVLAVTGPKLYDDLAAGIRKLIKDKVDIIFVTYELTAQAALEVSKEMKSDIPIVYMTRFHDPISYGIANSFKSSGNNSTGVATNLIESIQKNLLFIKEINPQAKKVAVFSDGFMIPGGSDQILSELKKQAPKLGLRIVEYKTANAPDPTPNTWKGVADKIKSGDIDAVYHLPVHFYDWQETDETTLAKRLHIPHAVPSEDMVTGGTFAFADDFHASAEQAATMVKKILNGAKSSDIPIEFGTKSILILNLKRQIEAGFKFPDSMLSIAEVKITQ